MIKLLLIVALISAAPAAFAKDYPWSAAQVLEPAALAKTLKQSPKEKQPEMFHVGFEPLFKTAHIPGSKYAGLAKEEAGLKKLRALLEKVPKSKEIVLYCGCCAFEKCPNLEPAFKEATGMGFENVKILNLPVNFNDAWTEKGYPTEASK